MGHELTPIVMLLVVVMVNPLQSILLFGFIHANDVEGERSSMYCLNLSSINITSTFNSGSVSLLLLTVYIYCIL